MKELTTLESRRFHDYPFKPHQLKIGDYHLNYIDEGSGECIFMIHGNPTWSYYYRSIVSEFSKNYRCIVPDHMGCGLSDKPQDYVYTLENHIANLKKLVEHIAPPKFSLIVHDWGGAIGMGVATLMPDRIEKIVILNTAAFISEHIPKRISVCRWPWWSDFFIRGVNGFAWPATFMSTQKKLSMDVKKSYLAPYNNWDNRVAIARFVQDIPMEKTHQSRKTLEKIESQLPSLKGRKLILWGGKDFCFNHHFYKKWKEIYPEALSFFLEDAGHYVIEDELDFCLKQMRDFFKGQ